MKVLIKINISDLQTESRMGDRKKGEFKGFLTMQIVVQKN